MTQLEQYAYKYGCLKGAADVVITLFRGKASRHELERAITLMATVLETVQEETAATPGTGGPFNDGVHWATCNCDECKRDRRQGLEDSDTMSQKRKTKGLCLAPLTCHCPACSTRYIPNPHGKK